MRRRYLLADILLFILGLTSKGVNSGSTKLEFISTVCGVGAYWDMKRRICVIIPSNESNRYDLTTPQSFLREPPKRRLPILPLVKLQVHPRVGHRDKTGQLERSGEDHYTSWEIVAMECGIGYRYNFVAHICERKYILQLVDIFGELPKRPWGNAISSTFVDYLFFASNKRYRITEGSLSSQHHERPSYNVAEFPKKMDEWMGGCEFPSPWNVSTISPELHVFGGVWNNSVHPIIKHGVPPTDMIQVLSSLQLLTGTTTLFLFLAHGFLSSSKSKRFQRMKDELLAYGENHNITTTVIILNWENGADLGFENYFQAAANIETVAEWLAPYVNATRTVMKQSGLNGKTLWGVGHSLGAHLLGIAGRLSDSGFDRVTGLDPAGPCFELHHQKIRLHKTDAKIVDVIHTDGFQSPALARILPPIHGGTLLPLGTVDFYPNWGFDQPAEYFTLGGSHTQSVDYFTWSISNPGKFHCKQKFEVDPSLDKPSYSLTRVDVGAEMGFHYDGTTRGNFYIATNSTEPWI